MNRINRRHEIEWAPEDPATPALIQPLLDDIGITGESREPVEHFLRAEINQSAGEPMGAISMGDLNLMAICFSTGFLHALKKQERRKEE